MRARTALKVAGLALMATAANCGDGTGPVSGTLVVALTGAIPARSAQFRLVGPVTAISPASNNVRVFSAPRGGDTLMVAVVANAGHTLSEANLVSLLVPDVAARAQYTLTLLQVASTAYGLQTISNYSLAILQN